MDQVCSKELSDGEQMAFGDVSLIEMEEPEQNCFKGEPNHIPAKMKVENTKNDLNTSQKGEGDQIVTDVLSDMFITLKIKKNCENTQFENLQNLLQRVESRPNNALEDDIFADQSSFQILEVKNSKGETQLVNYAVETTEVENAQQTDTGVETKTDKSCQIDEEITLKTNNCIETRSDDQYSQESSEESPPVKEQPTVESGSRVKVLTKRRSRPTSYVRKVVTNTAKKLKTIVEQKTPLNQLISLDPIAEEEPTDEAPDVCFEHGPIIVYDLPEPSQSDSLSDAAPPPIILLPKNDIDDAEDPSRHANTSEVRMKHLASILICQSCYALPITSLTVHMCKKGHQVCGHCFGAGCRVCPACTKPLVGRSSCVERFLERLCQLSPELFITESMKMIHSHRPIGCPHCKRKVASNTGLLNHFRFEHPTTQMYRLHYSVGPQEFLLPADCQGDLNTRVVALMEVGVGEIDVSSRDSVVCLILSCSLAKCTLVAVWCAALYEGTPPPINYRLQANTSTGGELAITGDVLSLHSSQEVYQVLDTSRCLILSSEDFDRQCAAANQPHISLNATFALA